MGQTFLLLDAITNKKTEMIQTRHNYLHALYIASYPAPAFAGSINSGYHSFLSVYIPCTSASDEYTSTQGYYTTTVVSTRM